MWLLLSDSIDGCINLYRFRKIYRKRQLDIIHQQNFEFKDADSISPYYFQCFAWAHSHISEFQTNNVNRRRRMRSSATLSTRTTTTTTTATNATHKSKEDGCMLICWLKISTRQNGFLSKRWYKTIDDNKWSPPHLLLLFDRRAWRRRILIFRGPLTRVWIN